MQQIRHNHLKFNLHPDHVPRLIIGNAIQVVVLNSCVYVNTGKFTVNPVCLILCDFLISSICCLTLFLLWLPAVDTASLHQTNAI